MEKLCAFIDAVLGDCQKKKNTLKKYWHIRYRQKYHALLCFLPFIQFLLLSYEILNRVQPVNYV